MWAFSRNEHIDSLGPACHASWPTSMPFTSSTGAAASCEAEISEREPAVIVMACSCGAQLARRIAREEFLDR